MVLKSPGDHITFNTINHVALGPSGRYQFLRLLILMTLPVLKSNSTLRIIHYLNMSDIFLIRPGLWIIGRMIGEVKCHWYIQNKGKNTA